MKKLGGSRKKDEGNIDLTPMLDVVFILLIFFVVTATFLSEQAIDAASSENNNQPPPPDQPEDQPRNILIEISQNNEIRINGEPRAIVESQLRPNIDRLKAENPAATVIIRPDRRSNVETLVTIMDASRLAGISAISIVEP